MSTFLMSTHGTGGDVLPFVRLGAALAGRGHAVTLLTHCAYVEQARRHGMEAVAIDTPEEYERHLCDARATLLSQLGSFDGAELLAYYRRHRLLEHLRDEYDQMLARYVPGDTVLLGRHSSSLSTLLAAESTGAPAAWIALTPTQLTAMPMTEYVHRRVLAGPINRMRTAAGLAPVRDWAAWLRGATAQIGLWPEWFDAAGPHGTESVALAGFLLNDDDGELPDELTDLLTRRPVLVSGTTGQMARDGYFASAIQGARATGREVLLCVRHRELLPGHLPPGVHWYPWLPFHRVLPQVGAIVHQGGIGTLGQAVAAGVPQLILGYSFDQPDNGARAQRSGIGAWLAAESWTAARVASALGPLLNTASPALAFHREATSATDALGTLVEAAEGLLSARQLAGTAQ